MSCAQRLELGISDAFQPDCVGEPILFRPVHSTDSVSVFPILGQIMGQTLSRTSTGQSVDASGTPLRSKFAMLQMRGTPRSHRREVAQQTELNNRV